MCENKREVCQQEHVEKETRMPYTVLAFLSLVWFLTECLSLFHAVTRWGVCTAWLITAVIIGYIWYKKCLSSDTSMKDRIRLWLSKTLSGLKELLFAQNEKIEKSTLFLMLGGILACITFVLAIATVPNNGDSMVYHLPRVCNWIENRSVSYYPAIDPRQLYYSPLSEYIILHIRLITGNDFFYNLVQWGGYVISANMVYHIARLLKCPKTYAAAGMLLFMMSPLAIAESITTQTDLTSTAVLLIFVYFILKMGLNKQCRISEHSFMTDIILCAVSIGIAFLTKMSICFMMIPFLIWLGCCFLLRKEKIGDVVKSCLVAGIIILVFACPSFVRNMKWGGSILPMEETRLMTQTLDPKLLFLNVCKNLTYETVGDRDAGPMYPVTMQLAERWHIDIEDPEITAYTGFWPKKIERLTENYRHDNAGSQKLFFLFGISLVAGIFCTVIKISKAVCKAIGKGDKKNDITIEGTFAWVCFLASLFMFIVIRWQPWGTRLLLGTVPLLCIFMMYICKSLFHESSADSIAVFLTLLIMILVATPSAIRSVNYQAESMREALQMGKSRFSMYYFYVKGLEEPETEIIEQIDEYIKAWDLEEGQKLSVGLMSWINQYPVWVELQKRPVKLRYVLLDQEPVDEYPLYIITMEQEERYPDDLQYMQERYMCIWRYDDTGAFKIYMKR